MKTTNDPIGYEMAGPYDAYDGRYVCATCATPKQRETWTAIAPEDLDEHCEVCETCGMAFGGEGDRPAQRGNDETAHYRCDT